MAVSVRVIVTHTKPDLDEITAWWQACRFGEKIFPGAKEAYVVFVSERSPGYKGRMPKECEQDGILLLGVGGGQFDEHPNDGKGRKENECAATLMAKALGIEEDPAMERILRFVFNVDTKPCKQPFDLAKMVENMHAKHILTILKW